MAVIDAVPQSYLKKLKPKIAKGKGMARPLHDYVYDYVRANEKEFVRGGGDGTGSPQGRTERGGKKGKSVGRG